MYTNRLFTTESYWWIPEKLSPLDITEKQKYEKLAKFHITDKLQISIYFLENQLTAQKIGFRCIKIGINH